MTLPPEQSDSEKHDPVEDSEEIADADMSGEELSLEQLSRAYAEVLQGREEDETAYDEVEVGETDNDVESEEAALAEDDESPADAAQIGRAHV